MASTLNDDYTANNSILEANNIPELDSPKMGTNTILGAKSSVAEKTLKEMPYIVTITGVRQVNAIGSISDKIPPTVVQRDVVWIPALILPL
jgi:hypothetical protein